MNQRFADVYFDAGQVALRRHDYAGAIGTFESLRRHSLEGSRVWLVFSYRLADAVHESGDPARGLVLLEDLLQRIKAPSTGERIDDVRGRILYRVALHRHDAGDASDAIALARQAAAAFGRSGIIAPSGEPPSRCWPISSARQARQKSAASS